MSGNTNSGGCLAAILLCLGLYACFHAAPDKTEAQEAAISGDARPTALDGVAAAVSYHREFDTDAARDAARDDLSGQTFESERGSIEYTDDCSGHEAGWSAAQGDGEDCGSGSSESYDAGCTAYRDAVEERVQRAREVFEQGDDAFELE